MFCSGGDICGAKLSVLGGEGLNCKLRNASRNEFDAFEVSIKGNVVGTSSLGIGSSGLGTGAYSLDTCASGLITGADTGSPGLPTGALTTFCTDLLAGSTFSLLL